MTLTDTHTHLYTEQFDNDRNLIVQAAIDAGIKRMILPAIDAQYIESQKQMLADFPDNCYAGAGLHPSSVNENFEKELEIVSQELETGEYIAVGEIGIDLYWDTTYKEQQIRAFQYQIELAKKHRLPIIIHTRSAFDEVYKIVSDNNEENLFGVFHSFTGSAEQAKKIANLGGFKIGINGIVTFKNSEISETLKQIAPDYIVAETDSPYLSPSPKRGKRNESKHLIYVTQKIADIYGLSLQELAQITETNASELFNIKPIV